MTRSSRKKNETCVACCIPRERLRTLLSKTSGSAAGIYSVEISTLLLSHMHAQKILVNENMRDLCAFVCEQIHPSHCVQRTQVLYPLTGNIFRFRVFLPFSFSFALTLPHFPRQSLSFSVSRKKTIAKERTRLE